MTAKCLPGNPKRDFNPIAGYNLRMKRKGADDLSGKYSTKSQRNLPTVELPNTSQMKAEIGEEVKAVSASNSTWRTSTRSSLEFPEHSQDKLWTIFSKGEGKNFYLQFNPEDFDSSEEDE